MTTTSTTDTTNPRDLIGRVYQIDGGLDRVVDVREIIGEHWAITERLGQTWASISTVRADKLAGKEVDRALWESAKRVVDAHVQRRADEQAFGYPRQDRDEPARPWPHVECSVGAGREKRSTHRWRYAMNRETSHCEHCGTHGRRCEYDDGDQTRCAYTPTRAQYIAAHAEDYRERGAPAPDRSDAECELRAGRRWDELYGDRIAPTPALAPVTPVTFTVESDEDARKIAAMLAALGYSVTRERREAKP